MTPLRVLRRAVSACLRIAAVQRVLIRIPAFRKAYGRRIFWDWTWTHPIDVAYGIDTSGRVPEEELRQSVTAVRTDALLASQIVGYIGSQPSIVRRALGALPDLREYCFVDLGCGKGRAAVVASEFPFARIVGVEISPELAAVARTNAGQVARKFPDRPALEIVCADATTFIPPLPKVVFYNYHAFGAELMGKLLRHVESLLGSRIAHCFLIYYNPVCGAVCDASPALTRWFADDMPYDASEHGFGPDRSDTVAIWQSVQGALPSPHSNRDVQIVLAGEMHAGLAPMASAI